MHATETSQYIPFDWAITPIDAQTAHCPSVHHTVLVYLLVILLTTVLGLVVGSRTLLNKITRGHFGKKESKSWMGMWVVQWGFHFGADLGVARLVTTAHGYQRERMPGLLELALFYTSRPRMAWMALGSLGTFTEWNSAAKQTMITEIIMQLMGCYYLGRTTDFAVEHGFYSRHEYNHWAQLMYAGSLFTLIMTLASLFGLCMALTGHLQDPREGKAKAYCARILGALVMIICGLFAFAGRWIFLIGYLKVAKEM